MHLARAVCVHVARAVPPRKPYVAAICLCSRDDDGGDCVVEEAISDDTKAEAALVLSNCAANSREAAELTVSCQGAVEALKSLFACQDVEAKRTAVGVFGNLSKCERAAAILREAHVREHVLLPALSAGDIAVSAQRVVSEQDLSVLSMRASAMMALTRFVLTFTFPRACYAQPPCQEISRRCPRPARPRPFLCTYFCKCAPFVVFLFACPKTTVMGIAERDVAERDVDCMAG